MLVGKRKYCFLPSFPLRAACVTSTMQIWFHDLCLSGRAAVCPADNMHSNSSAYTHRKIFPIRLKALNIGAFLFPLPFASSLRLQPPFLRHLTAKWMKWGLPTEYISNLRRTIVAERHLQGL